ncbi:uncharacterized protein METZ01_LOCUS288722 [marine metagenome]|uniref:Uncharacterized protein n=1 Tax=marine metagenome TaxID=408172 RepID=A0A382LGG0_9ZZZZ
MVPFRFQLRKGDTSVLSQKSLAFSDGDASRLAALRSARYR